MYNRALPPTSTTSLSQTEYPPRPHATAPNPNGESETARLKGVELGERSRGATSGGTYNDYDDDNHPT